MTTQNRFPIIRRGATFNGRDIKLYNGTGAGKTPMPIDDAVIEMNFRQSPAQFSAPVVFKFSTADNSITRTAVGVARMMPRIMNYPTADYEADLVLKFPNGTVKNYTKVNWVIL